MSVPSGSFQLPTRPLTPASSQSATTSQQHSGGPQPSFPPDSIRTGTNMNKTQTSPPPNILSTLLFREALTPQERHTCFHLGTTPGPAADFNASLQEHLSQLSSDRNNETKIWYLALPCLATTTSPDAQAPPAEGSIVAACKTVGRDILICEDGKARREKGYRLAAVVTHSKYRAFAGVIVAELLGRVVTWFDDSLQDGGGDAAASFVYAPVLNTGGRGGGGRISGGMGGNVVGAGTPVEYLNTRGLLHKDARVAIATDEGHWANQVKGENSEQQQQRESKGDIQRQDATDLGEGVYRTYYTPATASTRASSSTTPPPPPSQSQTHSTQQQRNPYAAQGYVPIHGVQAILWTASLEWAARSSIKRPLLPSSRPLTDFEEIEALAKQDVEQCIAFAEQFAKYLDGTQVAVLPTGRTVRAWLEQARFTAENCPDLPHTTTTNNVTTATAVKQGKGVEGRETRAERRKVEVFGAASNALPIWIYWYHDFSKSQLTIQRIYTPHVDESLPRASETRAAYIKALAQLLLDAMDEALRWGFSKVMVWEPDQRVEGAAEILGREMDIRVEFEERVGGGRVTAVRLRGGAKGGGAVKMQLNEYFAWSG